MSKEITSKSENPRMEGVSVSGGSVMGSRKRNPLIHSQHISVMVGAY